MHGFDRQQVDNRLGAHQACCTFRVGKLVSVSAEVNGYTPQIRLSHGTGTIMCAFKLDVGR